MTSNFRSYKDVVSKTLVETVTHAETREDSLEAKIENWIIQAKKTSNTYLRDEVTRLSEKIKSMTYWFDVENRINKEEYNEEIEKAVAYIKRLWEENAKLKFENTTLKSEIDKLKSENATLKSVV